MLIFFWGFSIKRIRNHLLFRGSKRSKSFVPVVKKTRCAFWSIAVAAFAKVLTSVQFAFGGSFHSGLERIARGTFALEHAAMAFSEIREEKG